MKTAKAFNESDDHYTSNDIRFTTKDGNLYAIAMGWPADGTMTVHSLSSAAGKIATVTLLGSDAPLKWEQTDSALVITLPDKVVSKYTFAVRITGADLKPAPLPGAQSSVTTPDAQGRLTLDASHADLHGDQVAVETRGDHTNIGFWDKASDSVSWTANFAKPGAYAVSIETAAQNADTPVVIELAGDTIEGVAPKTGSWDSFRTSELGQIQVKEAGKQTVTVRPKDSASWHAINLTRVILSPVQ